MKNGHGMRGFQRSNERIYEDVCEAMTLSPAVDASDVEVTVENGIVYLKGTVENRWEKKAAERSLDEVIGVRDVMNQIVLKNKPEERYASERL
jgi:osmotically-inducible protein OsmY